MHCHTNYVVTELWPLAYIERLTGWAATHSTYFRDESLQSINCTGEVLIIDPTTSTTNRKQKTGVFL